VVATGQQKKAEEKRKLNRSLFGLVGYLAFCFFTLPPSVFIFLLIRLLLLCFGMIDTSKTSHK
jgi:hypothetical protein